MHIPTGLVGSTYPSFIRYTYSNITRLKANLYHIFSYLNTGISNRSLRQGYHSSRPALKGYVRDCNNMLQTCRQIEVFVGSPYCDADKLWLAMSSVQSHNGVCSFVVLYFCSIVRLILA